MVRTATDVATDVGPHGGTAGRAFARLFAGFALLLAMAACGGTGKVATPTATTAIHRHGDLYFVTVNQGTAGPPTGSTLYALGLGDGTTKWQSQLNGVGSGATIGGGTLYIGDVQENNTAPQGEVTALNARSG